LHDLSEKFEGSGPFPEFSTGSFGSAIAYDQKCILWIFYVVEEVMFDSAGIHHTGRGDDDAGFMIIV
jgi:hypothetical protein